jgi:nucleoside-diphosphate-sugar epimerase
MLSLVTGAAGFVGQAIVRRLLAEGGRVRGLVRPSDPEIADLRALDSGGRLQIVAADVTDRDAVDAACGDIQRVFHSAAIVHAWAPIEEYRRVNVDGTRHVAEAAFLRGIQRFVHISTSDVFGLPQSGEVLTEAAPFREWGEPYPDSKIEAEAWLWRFHRERGLPVSVVNPGWVYGPGDNAFFPTLARSIRNRSMTFWQRDLWLPWTYIDNLADACVTVADHPGALGQGYLAYDGDDGPTLQEVCARIAAAIDRRPPTRHIPFGVAGMAARLSQRFTRGEPLLRTVDVKAFGYDWKFSNAKLRALGWQPQVSTEEGMTRAIEALRQQSA